MWTIGNKNNTISKKTNGINIRYLIGLIIGNFATLDAIAQICQAVALNMSSTFWIEKWSNLIRNEVF